MFDWLVRLLLLLLLAGTAPVVTPMDSAGVPPLPAHAVGGLPPRGKGLVPLPAPEPYSLRWRIGVGVSHRNPLHFPWPVARPGWFHNWDFEIHTMAGGYHERPRVAPAGGETALGMEYVPLVRTLGGELFQTPELLAELAARYPGQAWMIGNEPDIPAQDLATPAQYVAAYHTAYHALKAADPTARIIAGSLSQITPLRLRWLDEVWRLYRERYGEEMPVDVWGMHAFILPEAADGWGAGLPPGVAAAPGEGMQWTVEQHDDQGIVEEQVRRMRAWMAEHGQQDKPLWITEYGILMPAEYGFPPERVAAFMTGSFDLFRTLCDPALGLADDDGRLVQRWVWFSSYAADYPTGNLFTDEDRPTLLLDTLAGYLADPPAVEPGCPLP
jgi:hypothetical protein